MRISYDERTDELHLTFREGAWSRLHSADGIAVYLDEEGRLMSLTVLAAAERVGDAALLTGDGVTVVRSPEPVIPESGGMSADGSPWLPGGGRVWVHGGRAGSDFADWAGGQRK